MRQRLATAVPVVLSLAFLGIVVWWALRQEPPELPRTQNDLVALLGALGFYTLATLLRAERWHLIVRRAAIPATRRDTYPLTTVGYMGNNVLPARSGDLLRAFLLAPVAGARKREALGTVVAERILDAIALALVFATAALVLVKDAGVPESRVLAIGAASLAFLAVLGVVAIIWARRNGALERLRAALRPLAAPTRALPSLHGAGLLVISLAVWTLEAAAYLGVARAVNLDLSPQEALYVMAVTNLFALVPAAPGYVGTFDAAVLFAVHRLGATGSTAVTYLVLLRFVLFVPITLVGLLFLATRYGGWSQIRGMRLRANPG
jgi:glycosyltransferase 2 family protein